MAKDVVWDFILIALEIKDFHALSLMLNSAETLNLDLLPIKKKIYDAEALAHSKLVELSNILNFKYLTSDINEKLTEVLTFLLSFNMRGTLIDVGLGVKHHLDEILQMPSFFNRQNEPLLEDLSLIGEYFIDQNSEFLGKNSDKMKYPEDLYLHPLDTRYHKIVEIPQEELIRAMNHCKGCEAQTYFEQNLHNRTFFLLADHRFQFIEHIWNLGKDDILLNFSRLVLQYRNAELREEMNFDKHNWVKKPVVIKQDVNRKKGCLIPMKKFDDHPLARTGDVKVKRESIFGFFEKKARQSIVGWGSNPQEEEKSLKYENGPIRKSLRQCKTQEFRRYGPVLYEKFCRICEYMDTNPPYNFRLFLETKEYIEILWKSRDILFIQDVKRTDPLAFLLQEDPDALIDEAYFQIYRFLNRNLSNENRIFLYKLLCILTLYVPPSFDVEAYLLRFAYETICNNTFKKYYEKILDNLINYEGSVALRPYWLPSLQEIYFRFEDPVNFLLEYKFLDKSGKILFIESDTFDDIIKKILQSDIWGEHEKDKYSYWLYVETSRELPDIPVNEERNILEFLSSIDIESSNFILKKRIWQIEYSISVPKDSEAMIFTELKSKFVNKDFFSEIIDTNSVYRCSAILFMIYIVKEDKELGKQLAKIEKYLPDIIPKSFITKLSQTAIINKITEHLQKLKNNLEDLIREFIGILDFIHIRTGSFYFGFLQDSSNKRKEVFINVNTIGIFVFLSNSIRIPIQVILFNQILNIFSCKEYLEIRIVNSNKRSESFLFLVDQNIVKALHEDIISYSFLKMKENQRLTYILNFSIESLGQDNFFNYKLFLETLKQEMKKFKIDLENMNPIYLAEKDSQWNLEYPFIGDLAEVKSILRFSSVERKSIQNKLEAPKHLAPSNTKKIDTKLSETVQFSDKNSSKPVTRISIAVPEIKEQKLEESPEMKRQTSLNEKAGKTNQPVLNIISTEKEPENPKKLSIPNPPSLNLLLPKPPALPKIGEIKEVKPAENKSPTHLPIPVPPSLNILPENNSKRPSTMRQEITSDKDQKRMSQMRLSHCLNNVLTSLHVINSIKEETLQSSSDSESQKNSSEKQFSEKKEKLVTIKEEIVKEEVFEKNEQKVLNLPKPPPIPPPLNIPKTNPPLTIPKVSEEEKKVSESVEKVNVPKGSFSKVENLEEEKLSDEKKVTDSDSKINDSAKDSKKIQSSVRDRIAKRKLEAKKIEGATKISSERASKSRSRDFLKKDEEDEEDMSAADKRLAQVRARMQNRNQKFKK